MWKIVYYFIFNQANLLQYWGGKLNILMIQTPPPHPHPTNVDLSTFLVHHVWHSHLTGPLSRSAFFREIDFILILNFSFFIISWLTIISVSTKDRSINAESHAFLFSAENNSTTTTTATTESNVAFELDNLCCDSAIVKFKAGNNSNNHTGFLLVYQRQGEYMF